MTQQFIAAGKASRILGVTTKTLSRWAKAGKITFYLSPGGRYYYDVSAHLSPRTPMVKTAPEMASVSLAG